jgi:FKBP-type peptidyl-prolyl cis-trans isomerase
MLTIASCSKTKTYADYLNEERENIAKYISANNISVQNSKPEGVGEWKTADGKDIYYHSSSGLYYHQIEKGDGQELVDYMGYRAYVRYIGTNLFGNEIYNWTAKFEPDPDSFEISSSPNGKRFGIGFQEAVKNMGTGGHCKIIVPFNLGNGNNWTTSGAIFSDAANYTPMIYEIWLIRLE